MVYVVFQDFFLSPAQHYVSKGIGNFGKGIGNSWKR